MNNIIVVYKKIDDKQKEEHFDFGFFLQVHGVLEAYNESGDTFYIPVSNIDRVVCPITDMSLRYKDMSLRPKPKRSDYTKCKKCGITYLTHIYNKCPRCERKKNECKIVDD